MSKSFIIFLAIAGAIAGVIVVRFIFLNDTQIIGWNMFWKQLSKLDFDMFKFAFKSATFGKCVIGFIAGGLLGGGLGIFSNYINKK